MKNISIESLRQAGFKVCVIHSRYFYNELTKLSEIRARIDLANETCGSDEAGRPKFDWCHENHIDPMGGSTEVILTTPQGLSYSATARVKSDQPFNYRIGRNIAIGRCFADIREDGDPKVEVRITWPNQAEVRGFVAKSAFRTNGYIKLTELDRVHCFSDPRAKVEILDKDFSDECLDQTYFAGLSSTTSYKLHGQAVIGMPPSYYGFETKAEEGVTPTPAAVTA
jgi:hypothetical protein